MASADLQDLDHRALGAGLYNATWELLDLPDRTPEQTDQMIARAHASMYHWSQFSGVEPRNIGRGHWLCSRVHAVLGHADTAAYHAARYVHIARTQPVDDWDLAAALEASARAAVIGGDWDGAAVHEAEARQLLADVADDEDRELLEHDLSSLPHRPA